MNVSYREILWEYENTSGESNKERFGRSPTFIESAFLSLYLHNLQTYVFISLSLFIRLSKYNKSDKYYCYKSLIILYLLYYKNTPPPHPPKINKIVDSFIITALIITFD